MSQTQYITRKQLTAWMGWSESTIRRKVKQKCFPCYRFGVNDVKFRSEDITYYADSCKEGSFDQKEAA